MRFPLKKEATPPGKDWKSEKIRSETTQAIRDSVSTFLTRNLAQLGPVTQPFSQDFQSYQGRLAVFPENQARAIFKHQLKQLKKSQ
jgi:hypothetical protein